MAATLTENRTAIEDHREILEIIGRVELLSDLGEKQKDHYKFELDLEVIVYGRTYQGGKVGPYARLWLYLSGAEVIHTGEWAGNSFYILVEGELEVLDDGGKTERVIRHGETFGEMAVIEGDRRSTTVVVPEGSTAKVLELQRPALRLLRKFPKFAETFNAHYQQHSLTETLSTLREVTGDAFSDDQISTLADIARFKVYSKPHILFREGQPITHVHFINKGWVKVVRGLPAGLSELEAVEVQEVQSAARFLGAGNCFGLDAISQDRHWQHTVIIQSRTELLEIPLADLRFNPELMTILGQQFSAFSEADERSLLEPIEITREALAAREEITTGIVDGTNLLVMDMDLCVRCGNCSLACHKVHGHSRLLRRGILIERPSRPQALSIKSIMAPSVCMHCQDPECLTGCPTGAIGRLPDGRIDIHPQTCIGCGDCATQCPYNAISLIPTKQPADPGWFAKTKNFLRLTPQQSTPAATEGDDLLAIKCNLCAGTSLNPSGKATQRYSCEENCPTGALLRVNPREYFSEARNVLGTVYRDQTHALGRNIHKKDTVARLWHVVGVSTVVVIAVAAWWVLGRYSLDEPLGILSSVRWITGILGLLGILGAMLYLARKQVYRKRRGPLRYWMLAHVYLGIITCIVLMIHGGWHSGGLLTSALMISFDLTILSGIVGIISYIVVPRILTNIEDEPLLVDDLVARRKELREELALIVTDDGRLGDLINKKLPRRMFSLRYLLAQYVRPVKLTTQLAQAREEFEAEADRLALSSASRLTLVNAVETTATLRRVDALIYLHHLLKLWIAPHAVSTTLLLVLMVAHIVQVLYFVGR